jgi:hypothetical protein
MTGSGTPLSRELDRVRVTKLMRREPAPRNLARSEVVDRPHAMGFGELLTRLADRILSADIGLVL